MPVTLGIDSLMNSRLSLLLGTKIALVTNHTGYSASGRSTLDILYSSPNTELAALFSPEHGILGDLDSEVENGYHAQTGIPIFSLYGDKKKPDKEQLNGIDVLIYDIQDVGCRYYTYISTLLGCMEAAAETGTTLMVLDRPNPVSGVRIEGPLADPYELSFVACHPLPIRHGLTVGELAKLFVQERRLSTNLIVIPCEGWNRGMYWDDTGLMWINPSPNIRSLTQAILYSGIATVEFTNISVGRGTNFPFQLVGAPWIDPFQFASCLNANCYPGVKFMPVKFTPGERQYSGELCFGVQIEVIDREKVDSVEVGMGLMSVLQSLYKGVWDPTLTNTLLANSRLYNILNEGDFAPSLSHTWQEDLLHYKTRINPHLLYHE